MSNATEVSKALQNFSCFSRKYSLEPELIDHNTCQSNIKTGSVPLNPTEKRLKKRLGMIKVIVIVWLLPLFHF